MKVKIENSQNCQINVADKIDSITFDQEIPSKVQTAIELFLKNMPEDKRNNIKLILEKNDPKRTNYDRLKDFLISNGIPIAHGVSASAIYTYICKII